MFDRRVKARYAIVVSIIAVAVMIAYMLKAPFYGGDEPQYLYDAGVIQAFLGIDGSPLLPKDPPQFDGIARGPLNAAINAMIFASPNPASVLGYYRAIILCLLLFYFWRIFNALNIPTPFLFSLLGIASTPILFFNYTLYPDILAGAIGLALVERIIKKETAPIDQAVVAAGSFILFFLYVRYSVLVIGIYFAFYLKLATLAVFDNEKEMAKRVYCNFRKLLLKFIYLPITVTILFVVISYYLNAIGLNLQNDYGTPLTPGQTGNLINLSNNKLGSYLFDQSWGISLQWPVILLLLWCWRGFDRVSLLLVSVALPTFLLGALTSNVPGYEAAGRYWSAIYPLLFVLIVYSLNNVQVRNGGIEPRVIFAFFCFVGLFSNLVFALDGQLAYSISGYNMLHDVIASTSLLDFRSLALNYYKVSDANQVFLNPERISSYWLITACFLFSLVPAVSGAKRHILIAVIFLLIGVYSYENKPSKFEFERVGATDMVSSQDNRPDGVGDMEISLRADRPATILNVAIKASQSSGSSEALFYSTISSQQAIAWPVYLNLDSGGPIIGRNVDVKDSVELLLNSCDVAMSVSKGSFDIHIWHENKFGTVFHDVVPIQSAKCSRI